MRGVQGCWAILVLVEVLAASDAAAGPRDEVQFLIAMMTKLKEAGEILRALPARTQVVFMCDDDVVRAVCFCDASHSLSHSEPCIPSRIPSRILCTASHSTSLTAYCTVQRAVDNLYTKLVVAYWQQTQVPGELELLESPSFAAHRRIQDAPAVVTLNDVPVAPSNQLALIQKLVVATLKQAAQPGCAVLSAFAATHEDSEWLEDRDTEMC